MKVLNVLLICAIFMKISVWMCMNEIMHMRKVSGITKTPETVIFCNCDDYCLFQAKICVCLMIVVLSE